MGAIGAIIMSFFGAVFASITLATRFGWTPVWLALPFLVFAAIAFAAWSAMRMSGTGMAPSPAAERVIMWSSIGEGIGLFIAANVVTNIHRPEWLLPAMALVVGLHFLPMAKFMPFRPFYVLAIALLLASGAGFVLGAPAGPVIAGFAAALALWGASVAAVRRERAAKLGSKGDGLAA